MKSLFSDAFVGAKVLVTGHTGFKGSWLCAWLLDMGAEVCGLSDRIPTSPSLFEALQLDRKLRDERNDVRDIAAVAALVADFRPDYVFHLAAQAIVSTSYADPIGTLSTNVMGTASLLDALRHVDWECTAIVITSDKAYENVEWPWGYRETDRLGGHDVYSASKGAAELVFHAYHQSFLQRDMPVRIASARAGNVIGGGDWAADRIVADCVRAWLRNDKVEIRSPRATRPWQHVLEPLSGYLHLAGRLRGDASLHGESFNFGPRGEQNATVVELLTELSERWGFQNADHAYRVSGDVPFNEAGLLKLSIDKALLQLKWEPNLSYRECAAFTGDWYREVMHDGEDAAVLTSRQLRDYEMLAAQRSRVWACVRA